MEAGLGCAILPAVAVREAADQANLVVRPLSPRLYRKLAIVMQRDKVLNLGMRETIRALKSLSRKGA